MCVPDLEKTLVKPAVPDVGHLVGEHQTPPPAYDVMVLGSEYFMFLWLIVGILV